MEEYLKIILKEMCNRVGAPYEEMDFHESFWFTKYRWTTQQEDDFVKWLTDLLYNNKDIRKAFFQNNIRTKTHCKRGAKAFVFNYGWSYTQAELDSILGTEEENQENQENQPKKEK